MGLQILLHLKKFCPQILKRTLIIKKVRDISSSRSLTYM